MIRTCTIFFIAIWIASFHVVLAQNSFSSNPDSVVFHTEDIPVFWKVFDRTFPKFSAKVFQQDYIDAGSKGLKGFVNDRIQSGKNLSKKIKDNLEYYEAIRESSFSIDSKREQFHACFLKMKEIYPKAVFPDVYFVIGAKNSGGTMFSGGLIIGAEMFGRSTEHFKPLLDIEYVDEVVAHELVHFQQNQTTNYSLLAQCIREGSADFIGELISGGHSNQEMHEYGNAHKEELWAEFVKEKDGTDWSNWLYRPKKESRPRDLGYWIGYKISEAYYRRMEDKQQAINDMLNIIDFTAFLEKSGYNGE